MTLPIPRHSPLVLYVLHFDTPLKGARHYVGSAYAGRLVARLAEHSRGEGARFTAAMARRGIGFVLAACLPIERRQAEHRIKRSGRQARSCPICNPRAEPGCHVLIGRHFAPSKPAEQSLMQEFLQWTNTAR